MICDQQLHQRQSGLVALLGCTLVGTSAFKACLLLVFPAALVSQAFAWRLATVSVVEASCLLVAFLTGLTHAAAACVVDAAACKPRFAALLLPSAMVSAVLHLLPDALEQAVAVLLPRLTALVVLSAAAADALDLVVTPKHAAAGLAVLGRTAASLACLAGLTALTPLAAALALALVVIPVVGVAAFVAVTVHDVTAGPEALVGTAGLLGAAIDHAERQAGRVVKEGTLEGDMMFRGELAEYRLLLLLSVWPQVSECLLGVSVLLPPTRGALGAVAVVNFLTIGLEAWMGRSATTPACACCDAKAAAGGVELTSLLSWTDRETGREPLSIFLPFLEVLKVCLPVLSVPTEATLGAAAALICSALRPGAWMGRSATTPACVCCDAKAVGVGLTTLMFFAGMKAGRELRSSAGDAASRAGGVVGKLLLMPLPPLPPHLGLLLCGAWRLREGSCA